jgi:HEAT repeat protein
MVVKVRSGNQHMDERLFPSFEAALGELRREQEDLSKPNLYGFSSMRPEDLDRLQKEWSTVDFPRRRQILRMLLEIAEDSFEVDFNAFYRHCLGDEDEEARAKAIEGLWEDEDPRLIPILIDLVRYDPSLVVRAQAASSLGRFSLLTELGEIGERYGKGIKSALIQIVDDPSELLDVRRRAVESLGCMSGDDVEDMIAQAYGHPEEKMRISAVYAMGRNASDQWYDMLVDELTSDAPEMRYEAAWACGELRNQRAVPLLIQLIDDPDPEVQGAAIWALGQAGGKPAREALLACSEGDNDAIREASLEALAELDFFEEPFLETFTELLSGSDEGFPLLDDWEEEEVEDSGPSGPKE